VTEPPAAGSAPGCRPLPAASLIHACRVDALDFADTAELSPLEAPLGQERVSQAIEFAVGMRPDGYNLYLMGTPGVGRHHLLLNALAARAGAGEPPSDWCYVADFDHPDRPRALALPAGRGAGLRQDMRQWLEDLLTALPAAFQSDEYRRRAQEIQDEFKQREDRTAEALGRHAAERGVALVSTPTGYSLVPMKDGKLLNPQEYDALSEEEKASRQEAMQELKEELRSALGRVPMWKRELHQRMRELEAEVTDLTVSQLRQDLERRYADLPAVLEYLAAVCRDVVEHGAMFMPDDGEGPGADDPRFTRYRVNLLVDNSAVQGAPVVYEDNPTYQNLLGRIEHVAHLGTLSTDFTLIKPGALHRANGGYLVLDAERLLQQPFAWSALKRALNGDEIRIESADRLIGLVQTLSLDPEPIPLRVKLALVGERYLYYLLKAYDPDFGPLFKVIADFSEDMPRAEAREMAYARLIATLQQGEGLRALERAAVARVIDWAARRAGDGEKLSLHLGSLTQLLQEADYFASRADCSRVESGHVQQAIDAQVARSDQLRSRLHEAILRDALLIDTAGRQLGQVNGLVLIQAGDYAFGSPTRISATARIGSGEVVDIESETDLGGSIHSKGVMILAAYLANRYARHQPLSLAASLVFEQSYGQVEGDSASLGELCALLSAIGDLSLEQSLAVTGSVNQHGQVQAVGGVNEKIEGFFDICSARGLNGHQGVVIPAANVRDLMLREDLRRAVAAGQFQVYAADHADQVMALLTGMPAGMPDVNGLYPPDSCNGRVQIRLIEWTAMRQHYSAAANVQLGE
jgi:lon-related putative ATP-dependent protease